MKLITDFFGTRWRGTKGGFDRTVDGVGRAFHQFVGYKDLPAEKAPGAIGFVRDSVKAVLNGLVGEKDGVFRLDKGNEGQGFVNSRLNPMRYVRRGVAAIINSSAVIEGRFFGIFSAKIGNFLYRWRTGISSLLLSPFIGDIHQHMNMPGEMEEDNENSPSVASPEPPANDSPEATPQPAAPASPAEEKKVVTKAAEVEVETTEVKKTEKPKGDNVVEMKQTRKKKSQATEEAAEAA